MTAYYNEVDPKTAEWLRNLIFYDLIAPGDVDERSIEDVRPSDLKGYDQCHFFAGIGVWSYSLRLAGWPDNRRVWTGSCPCQPFSAAGKGAGTSDERHLWPAWYWLIEHSKPAGVPIFGEQVASPAALAWLDLVCADMEAAKHAVRAIDLCAAGAGAPHIRQRLYWVADDDDAGRQHHAQRDRSTLAGCETPALGHDARGRSGSSQLANTNGGNASAEREQRSGEHGQQQEDGEPVRAVDDDFSAGLEGHTRHGDDPAGWTLTDRPAAATSAASDVGNASSSRGGRNAGAVSGAQGGAEGQVRSEPDLVELASYWSDCAWIYCRDNKWRPVEPGTFPLAHGAPARVGRLRGYGNAIVAPLAAEFIKAYMSLRAPAL